MQEWNKQRTLAIERSLQQFLYPQMAKELKNKLIAEAKENIVKVMNDFTTHFSRKRVLEQTDVSLVSVLQSCCKKLYNWLKVAPYRPDQQVEEDDDLMDESQGKGIRVLGVAFASGRYVFMIITDRNTTFFFSIKRILGPKIIYSHSSCS